PSRGSTRHAWSSPGFRWPRGESCVSRPEVVLRRNVDGGGLIAAAGLALVCTAASWIRWANYWGGNFDLTVFDQSAYRMSRGHSPHVSLLGRDLFSDHLSPVMALFAVPYRIVPTVFWLFL